MTAARPGLTALLLLSVAGCDRQPAPPPIVADNSINVTVAEAPAPVAGCGDGWTVTLDRPSFGNNGGGRSFADRRLAMFRDALETTVRGAVSSACADGELDPAKAAAVKQLTVQSASGAADPTFFGESDAAAVSLQWTFAENDLTIPSEMELRGGLVCWTDPASDLCAEREP